MVSPFLGEVSKYCGRVNGATELSVTFKLFDNRASTANGGIFRENAMVLGSPQRRQRLGLPLSNSLSTTLIAHFVYL